MHKCLSPSTCLLLSWYHLITQWKERETNNNIIYNIISQRITKISFSVYTATCDLYLFLGYHHQKSELRSSHNVQPGGVVISPFLNPCEASDRNRPAEYSPYQWLSSHRKKKTLVINFQCAKNLLGGKRCQNRCTYIEM